MSNAPGIAMNRTAVVLLASGLSRRYGSRDKMLEPLGGKPLIEHSAGIVSGVDALARIAVCPADRKQIGERLINRFVIAVNKRPKEGLGHSIAVGAKVALQFKPDAIVFVMGDMAFIEEWMLLDLVDGLGDGGADIVHSGGADGVRPPTAFGAACFDELAKLEGDEGARPLVQSGRFKVASIGVPAPLLIDVDTKEDIAIAREQYAIREKHRAAGRATFEAAPQVETISVSQHGAGFGREASRR